MSSETKHYAVHMNILAFAIACVFFKGVRGSGLVFCFIADIYDKAKGKTCDPSLHYLGIVIIFWILMVASLGCGAYDLKEFHVDSIDAGVERGFEAHHDVKYCSIFLMTKKQVAEFFGRAKLVTETEAIKDYDWSPCYVSGTMHHGDQILEWKINALYLGELGSKDNLKQYYYCDNCDDLFVPQK